MLQAGARLDVLADGLPPLTRGEEDADLAVGQDVGDLGALEHRVHRHEDALGVRGGEHRGDRVDPLVGEDRDPVAAVDTEGRQDGAEVLDPAPQLAVGQRGAAAGQGRAVAADVRLLLHQVVQAGAQQPATAHHGTHVSSL